MIFVELEGLDVTRVTFGSNGIHTRFTRLAGIVRTSFSNEPHSFSAHLQEDGALEFKEDRHAQNVYTVKNLAFVVCRAKGRLRLAVLLGSGLVRSFGVLVFRRNSERIHTIWATELLKTAKLTRVNRAFIPHMCTLLRSATAWKQSGCRTACGNAFEGCIKLTIPKWLHRIPPKNSDWIAPCC